MSIRSRSLAGALLVTLASLPIASGVALAITLPWGGDVLIAPSSEFAVPRVVADGASGAYVVWRAPGTPEVRAQRLTSTGGVPPGWPADGRHVINYADELLPLADGAGGFFLASQTYADAALSHVSASGTIAITSARGFLRAPAPGPTSAVPAVPLKGPGYRLPNILLDGAGGCFFSVFHTSLISDNPMMRRYGAGCVPFGASATKVAAWAQGELSMAPAAGGAVLCAYENWPHQIWLQRVLGDGTIDPSFTGDDHPLSALQTQQYPFLVGDGAGGGYVIWQDTRNGAEQTFAQHVDADGHATWTADGQALSNAGTHAVYLRDGEEGYFFPQSFLVTDGQGGAYAAWIELGDAMTAEDLRLQHLVLGGVDPLWPAEGLRLGGAGNQGKPRLVADGAGGAMVVWEDRSGGDADVRALWLDAAGAPRAGWTAVGMILGDPSGDQRFPDVATDGAGRFTIVWQDWRSRSPEIRGLQIMDTPVPVQVALASAGLTPQGVRLEWYATDAAHLDAFVQRRTASTGWLRLGRADVTGSDRLVFEDRAVVPGERYGYRLGFRDGNGEAFGSESWIDVPRVGSLALAPPRPNPASRELAVECTLPNAAPARIELIDTSGRRVRSEALPTVVGRHRVELSGISSLAPGVYVVRLVQGAATRTARVSIVP